MDKVSITEEQAKHCTELIDIWINMPYEVVSHICDFLGVVDPDHLKLFKCAVDVERLKSTRAALN